VKRTIATWPLDAHAPRWALPFLLLPMLALPAACTRGPAELEPRAQIGAPLATNAAPVAPRKVTYHASWAEYYTSMADLKANADIAVLGTVSSIGATEQPTPNGPVYSLVTLDVERTPFARASGSSAMPATVSFVETGGTLGGVTYELEDDPLFKVGDHVLMFFTEYSPGKYRVTGGPTGRFTVSGGVVTPTVKGGVPVPTGTTTTSLLASLQMP
jgi:hypothetical protein